ncbi:ABC transporter substrate-binding protein [uncultured Limimaricola sp.]|mgnify:CR=1 FL=1|uniref:ABC transporter substrate-binding protein n=1 Tax=uncultured Limimaricola sp. TaxID=2211667 RepID=UPI0030F845AF
MSIELSIGFMPLVDAAPLIAAHEMGFAREEGLALRLERAPSWSTLRDMLAFGGVEAAHMLSPVPIAMALGLGGVSVPLSAVSVLAVNGDVIGVSRALAERMRDQGFNFDFADAVAARAALRAAAGTGLRIGVPFPFSMHAELLHYWLSEPGMPAIDIRTVPPPLMAEAIAAGEIDAFCVGEPWGSIAVENGVGELLLPGAAIWAFAPGKVLAVRTDWAAREEDSLGRLMRAVWRAGRWLDRPGSRTTAAEIMARREHLNLPAEVIDRALSGRLTVSPRGETRRVEAFVEFHAGAASFPWRSQAAWIAERLAERAGQDPQAAMGQARAVFRTDLYRRLLQGTGAEMPGASEKLEGTILADTPASSESGRLVLRRDRFFDGRVFDLSLPD